MVRFARFVAAAASLSVLALALIVLSSGRSVTGATYTVDSLGDAGGGTLRQAILDANANGGFDTITFDPTVFPAGAPGVIAVATELPAMTDPEGTSVDGTGAGVIIDGSALAADEDGLIFHTSAGVDLVDATVRNVTVRFFPRHGIFICGGAGTNPCINDDNTDALVDSVTLTDNGVHGVAISGSTVVSPSVTNSIATGNGFHGIDINSCTGNLESPSVTGNTILGSGFNGININSCDDVVDATVSHNTTADSDNQGIYVNSGDNTISPAVTDNISDENDDDGIYLNAGENLLAPLITRNTVDLNSADGVHMNAGGILDDAEVSANLIRNNLGHGVYLNAGAVSGTHTRAVNGNIICGNVGSGLTTLDALAQNAEGNWWGSPTGPSPIGTGNPIVDAGGGEVDFTPWIDTLTSSADPAQSGIASNVRFQFSDASATVFLGDGLSVSDPFIVSTDNGIVTSSEGSAASVASDINAPAGTVLVTLTPAAEGQANVEIEAPCGLDALVGASLAIDVGAPATPTPTPTPTPSPTPSPTPTPTPTPTPIPGQQVVWGNNNCSDEPPNPVDSLITLRYNAGLSANTGDCPEMGTQIEVFIAGVRLWGDIDCDDAISPVDSLKLLRFDAGLSVQQADGCPDIGAEVNVTES